MRRLPLLAVLVVSAVIGLSVWLVIGAQSDPEPLPVAERLPRDDDQSQQQETQAEPEPSPDEEDTGQEAAEQEPSEEEATEATTEQDESEPEAASQTPTDPADVVIRALDLERPIAPRAAPEPVTHVLAEGETLGEIADRYALALADLIEANSLETPDLVDVGTELVLPLTPPPPEPPLVNEVAPNASDDGVVYGTVHDHERGVINTVVVALSQSDPNMWLAIACVDGVGRTYLLGLPTAEGLSQVYWRTDDGAIQTDRWSNQPPAIESQRPQLLFELLFDIQTVWIRVGSVDLTFRVESMLSPEIEDNLDNCGR